MKYIVLAAYNHSLDLSSQLAKYFTRCGPNPEWTTTAFHLSAEYITGHKPESVSGDFYIIENEEKKGAWQVVILTYAKDRPGHHTGEDQIEVVAEFSNAFDAWNWLRDPVSQAFFLHASPAELNEARGIVPAPVNGSPLHEVLASDLSPHCYTMPFPMEVEKPDGKKRLVHARHLGFGRIHAVTVHGSDQGRAAPGYPSLDNHEALAVSQELARRWNTHGKLQAALVQAIEEAGFSVAGPTDHRAAEHGEPKWVCEARAVLAESRNAIVEAHS